VSGRSLRLRLLLAAAGTILAALLVAWGGLTLLFERHVERRYSEQLGIHLQSLAARLTVGPDGALSLSRPLSEPLFEQPLSGLYWTITSRSGRTLRSRSLWDQDLPPPAGGGRTERSYRTDRHLILERTVRPLQAGQANPAAIQVAMELSSIASARREFARELALSLAFLGFVLMAAAWVQTEIGLRPLDQLRAAAAAIETEPSARLAGGFPREVLPLVEALNRLLDARASAIAAARARAGDLAHGLRTPLAALRNQADRLARAGEADSAERIRNAVAAMDRQVDRELTRARAAVSAQGGAASCEVRPLVDQLIAVVARTADGERLAWANETPAGWRVAVAPDDLAEALGPLLENAARHARHRVRVSADQGALAVDDDGPGMAPQARDAALARGARLDERGGAGLGLAIAAQILAPYGWGLDLAESPMGGLRARLGPC
jgi:signal transduction histidine kinase